MNLQGAWVDNEVTGIELNNEKFDVYFIIYI